jgi:hypothetical protein
MRTWPTHPRPQHDSASRRCSLVLGAGGYITKPRNEMRAMWNAGDVLCRTIEVIGPAGLEGFFEDSQSS